MISYGLIGQSNAVQMTRVICNVLGNGANDNAHKLIIETAQQETKLGFYPDAYPFLHGVGLCQFDRIGFEDVRERTSKHNNQKLKKSFGVNVNEIRHRELAYSPFLSLLFCRLFYILKPEVIPKDITGRAEYWKKYYNTVLGKGTVSEYLENSRLIKVSY